MKIYLPEDTTYNKCYVVQNEEVIRAYDRIPAFNTSYSYRDYYIRSDYIFREGTGTWSQYTTLPVCLPSDTITNSFYYRIDFTQVLINVFIISIFGLYFPWRIFKSLFGRRFL